MERRMSSTDHSTAHFPSDKLPVNEFFETQANIFATYHDNMNCFHAAGNSVVEDLEGLYRENPGALEFWLTNLDERR